MEPLAVTIRPAELKDLDAIYQQLHSFAVQMREDSGFQLTKERLEHLFTEHGLKAFLAEYDNCLAGIITYYETISTFSGHIGLHIEDMYINKDFQRQGIGKTFMETMIEETKNKGYKKLTWHTLRENHGANKFYRNLGAIEDEEWKTFIYYID